MSKIDERTVDNSNDLGKLDPNASRPVRGDDDFAVPEDPARLFGLTSTRRTYINVSLTGDKAGFITTYDKLIGHTFLILGATTDDDLKLATIQTAKKLTCNDGNLSLSFTPASGVTSVSVILLDLISNPDEPTRGYVLLGGTSGGSTLPTDLIFPLGEIMPQPDMTFTTSKKLSAEEVDQLNNAIAFSATMGFIKFVGYKVVDIQNDPDAPDLTSYQFSAVISTAQFSEGAIWLIQANVNFRSSTRQMTVEGEIIDQTNDLFEVTVSMLGEGAYVATVTLTDAQVKQFMSARGLRLKLQDLDQTVDFRALYFASDSSGASFLGGIHKIELVKESHGVPQYENVSDVAVSAILTLSTKKLEVQLLFLNSNFYFKEAIDDFLKGKQDKLTSGTTIKTVQGQSLLGSGDVVINQAWKDYVQEGIFSGIRYDLDSTRAFLVGDFTIPSLELTAHGYGYMYSEDGDLRASFYADNIFGTISVANSHEFKNKIVTLSDTGVTFLVGDLSLGLTKDADGYITVGDFDRPLFSFKYDAAVDAVRLISKNDKLLLSGADGKGIQMASNPEQPSVSLTGNVTEGGVQVGTYTIKYVPFYDTQGAIVGGTGTIALDITQDTTDTLVLEGVSGFNATILGLSAPSCLIAFISDTNFTALKVDVALLSSESKAVLGVTTLSTGTYEGTINIYNN